MVLYRAPLGSGLRPHPRTSRVSHPSVLCSLARRTYPTHALSGAAAGAMVPLGSVKTTSALDLSAAVGAEGSVYEENSAVRATGGG